MSDDLLTEHPFTFWMPLRKSLADADHGRYLEGIAATPDWDQQGESMDMGGMDFSPFLAKGWINWNHQEGPENLIGKPLEACIKSIKDGKQGFYIKARLLDGQPRADAAWMLVENLEKSGWDDRRIGWSVQGGVTQRSGARLIKTVVRHVALTHEPVNASTFAGMCKSLAKSMTLGTPYTGSGTDGQGGGPVIHGIPMNNALALQLQNMDPHLTSVLWGDCVNPGASCYDPATRRFTNGRHGVVQHLMNCRGMTASSARNLVLHIMDSGIF